MATKSTTKSKVIPMKRTKPVAAPVAAPKSSTKEGKPVKKKAPEATKYTGRTTGMRVQEYQDRLMADNFKAKLTDAQLAKKMRDEFPNAVSFTEAHVSGIRSLWNNGKRASQDGVRPKNPLPKFGDDGEEISPRARSASAADRGKKGAAKKGAAKPTAKKKAAPPPEPEEDEEEDDDLEEVDEDEEFEEDEE